MFANYIATIVIVISRIYSRISLLKGNQECRERGKEKEKRSSPLICAEFHNWVENFATFLVKISLIKLMKCSSD